MYSGIVTNQGIVIKKAVTGSRIRFVFRFRKKEKSIQLGESIAIEGVCLTVAGLVANGFAADVVHETLQATTLGMLEVGSRVNLERSLKYGDEMGGHFVTGHIDGKGRITHIEKRNKNWLITFAAPKEIMACIAQKGSVAVDGISLTVQSLTRKEFKITIIPHTLKETTLGRKKTGDFVNLEVDLITRYLQKMLASSRGKKTVKVSQKSLVKYLKSQGF